MFNFESGHRITFLAQRRPSSLYIRPRYRYAYGNGTRLESKARFRRGSALAGMAWDSPGGNNLIATDLPDFGNNESSGSVPITGARISQRALWNFLSLDRKFYCKCVDGSRSSFCRPSSVVQLHLSGFRGQLSDRAVCPLERLVPVIGTLPSIRHLLNTLPCRTPSSGSYPIARILRLKQSRKLFLTIS